MRHPQCNKPELVAPGPREVFSWDITKLRGPHKGEWFALLVMLDIFSRFIVGWMLVRRANAELAAHFIAQTKDFRCARIILSGIEVMHMIRKRQLRDGGRAQSSAQQFYALAT